LNINSFVLPVIFLQNLGLTVFLALHFGHSIGIVFPYLISKIIAINQKRVKWIEINPSLRTAKNNIDFDR